MKKVLSFCFLALTAVLFYIQPAIARDFADIYTDCGLGAIIAPKNSAVAAVTNVTWDSGTTAISSNITSPDTCKGGQDRAAAFIHESYRSIESDLASGKGQYLDSLVLLSGCPTEKQAQLKAALRKDFSNAVADASYTSKSRFEKSELVYNMLYKDLDKVVNG